jgi:hypothetical protein
MYVHVRTRCSKGFCFNLWPISPFNTQTMHIKSFYKQQYCYVSLKTLYPGGIQTRVFSFLRRMRCPLHHAARANLKVGSGGDVLVESSTPCSKEIGAMGREIESRQGICRVVIFTYIFKKKKLKVHNLQVKNLEAFTTSWSELCTFRNYKF